MQSLYSILTGIIYSDEVSGGWQQDGYKGGGFSLSGQCLCCTSLYEENTLLNIMDECKKAGMRTGSSCLRPPQKLHLPCGYFRLRCQQKNIEIKSSCQNNYCSNKINQLLMRAF